MARKKTDHSAILALCETGEEMATNDRRHMKLQGFSGSGKSTFALTYFSHGVESRGLKPEESLFCIIDCDSEGQAELVKRDSIMPANLRPRILRRTCSNPSMVKETYMAYIHAMAEHQKEHPNGFRVIMIENEAAFYLGVRNYYSVEVHGKDEGELLLSRQQQARREGKKTLPAFEEGQMHSYKVINKMFTDPYVHIKMAAETYDYHFIATTLLRNRIEGYGTAKENTKIEAAGRPDITDPLFDWIVQFDSQQRTKGKELETRYLAQVKKSRSCKAFKIDNPTQDRFWKAADKMKAE
tara:strand:- start:286 stop:1176 length:891 start_codon:yes stop_codon:yes gene_type:complete